MKLDIHQLAKEAAQTTSNEVKMRMSDNAQSMVFQLFTKNVYSNPIGSVVREITSNCFDSHIEANVDMPVIIKHSIDAETEKRYISFIDFGVGLSVDRIENVYGVYFESTKRVDNTQIGGFGIGCKTPLAYKRSTGNGEGEYDNSFFVITNFDGIKYFYNIYEGVDSPMINRIHQEPTTERNGTEVRIPVLTNDVSKFASEMTRQLYYFENVVFEGFEDQCNYPPINDYQIVRANNFIYRGTDYSQYIHISLGQVAYPIDYATLGLNQNNYRIPVALKLNVGDVNVTASRESIDYSEKTIKMIKVKLDEIKAELIQMLQKQYSNVRSLEQYYITKHNFGTIIFPNQESININNLVTQKDLKFSSFKYESIELPAEHQLFDFFFKSKRYGRPAKKGKYNAERAFTGTYDEITKPANNTGVYFVEGKFKRKLVKQAYLRDVNEFYNIITKKSIWDALEWNEQNTIDNLNKMFGTDIVSMYDKDNIMDEELELIMDLQDDYMEIVRNSGLDYDTIDVPQDFIEQRKLDRIVQPDANILVTLTNEYKKFTIHTNVIRNHTGMIFYGTQNDRHLLQSQREAYEILFNKDTWKPKSWNDQTKYQAPMFLEVAKKYLKYITPMEHAHHCTDANAYLFHRKQDKVNAARYASSVESQLSYVEYLYKSPNFKLVNENVHKLYRDTYQAVNNLGVMNNYAYNSREIHQVIERQDLQKTSEIKKLDRDFKTILSIISENEQLIRFFNTGEIDREQKEAFAAVLKKVMVFPKNM